MSAISRQCHEFPAVATNCDGGVLPTPAFNRIAPGAGTVSTRQQCSMYKNTFVNFEPLSYPQIEPMQHLLPPDGFTPFFTVVKEADTDEYHHPTVYYVFSDDDRDLYTPALVKAVGDTSAMSSYLPAAVEHSHGHCRPNRQQPDGTGDEGTAIVNRILPPPARGFAERYVIVDLAADGKTVTSATSLSREWQVVGTSVALAPSFANDNNHLGLQGGMIMGGAGEAMLKLEGTGLVRSRDRLDSLEGQQQRKDQDAVFAAGLGKATKAAGRNLFEGLEDLLRRFDGGVRLLRNVIGSDLDGLIQQQRKHEQGQGETRNVVKSPLQVTIGQVVNNALN